MYPDVYTMRSNYSSFVNFGFSYTKSKNFDQILTAADRLNDKPAAPRTLRPHAQTGSR